MNPEAFSDLATARHSVRDFRPDPVPSQVLDAILDDARQAPSWSNTRPFMVALATGEQATACARPTLPSSMSHCPSSTRSLGRWPAWP